MRLPEIDGAGNFPVLTKPAKTSNELKKVAKSGQEWLALIPEDSVDKDSV